MIAIGSKGPEVRTWQDFLRRLSFYAGGLDGDFGPKTETATKSFQTEKHVAVTGKVDDTTLAVARGLGYGQVKKSLRDSVPLSFKQAKWFQWADRSVVDYLVIHTAEVSEVATAAEAVAAFFNTMPPERKASAHFAIDCDSVVQCVDTRHVAFHAPGVNRRGIGYELCTRAKQTRAEWLDGYGVRMLGLAATMFAADAVDWNVPIVSVDAEELLVGTKRGITTHAQAAKACKLADERGMTASPFFNKGYAVTHKHLTDHFDPGPVFEAEVFDWFLGQVRERLPPG